MYLVCGECGTEFRVTKLGQLFKVGSGGVVEAHGRVPVSDLFDGPGKVGGLLNFIPKSGKNEGGYLSEPTGEVTATYGSYNKKTATAQLGLPVAFGDDR